MSLFAVQYTYAPAGQELAALRPRHRAYLAELAQAGTLALSGPYLDADGATTGALLIVRAHSADEARQALAGDPFQVQGLVTAVSVQHWNPVLGAWHQGPLADQF